MTSRTLHILSFIALLCMQVGATAIAAPFSEPDIKAAIVKDSFLRGGGLGFVDIGGIRLLVSVAFIPIENNSPRIIINARRLAKLRAEATYSKFISGEQITAESTLTTKSVIERDNKTQRVHYQEQLTEIQRAYTKMSLSPVDFIEGWVLDNPLAVLHVIYSTIPSSPDPS